MSENLSVKNQNVGATVKSIIGSVSDKFTAEDLTQILPHVATLQEINNPNSQLSMEGMKENQNQTNQTIRGLAEIEIGSYKEELHKAETFEEKKYWKEAIETSTKERIQTVTDTNKDNNVSWLQICAISSLSIIATIGYVYRRDNPPFK